MRSKVTLVPILVMAGILTGMLLAGYGLDLGAEESKGGDSAGLTASALKAGGSPPLGDPDAPVTIVEYGDYQCTFCYRFHQTTLKVLQEEFVQTGQASLIFKDFALNGPDSILAARASHCAGDQGMYWEYHDEIYDNWAGERTGWVTDEALERFAGTVGLDISEFGECMKSGTHGQAVLDAYKAGQRIGIDATPSFLISDGEKIMKIRGNQPLEVFERAIDELLADQT